MIHQNPLLPPLLPKIALPETCCITHMAKWYILAERRRKAWRWGAHKRLRWHTVTIDLHTDLIDIVGEKPGWESILAA